MDLSVIVPLFNEEENVFPLYRSIVAALDPLAVDYELILVDDGSSDATVARARQLAEQDKRLRLIILRRNYGQTPAMAAGIDHASGQILVTMDGDLQNDPADIPILVEQIHAGYDIVVGWRHERQDKLITRRIPSLIANWLIGKVTGVPIRDNGCSLKAYRGDVIKEVPLYSEMHRFIPAMASIAGARIVEVRVRHHPRRFGSSKYGLTRIYKVLIDLLAIETLIVSAQRPMTFFGTLAAPILLLAIASIGSSIYLTGVADINALPLGGMGVLLGALVFFLVLSGALAELLLRIGDPGPRRLPIITAHQNLPQPVLEPQAHSGERETDA
ncbi:glycosyltransferase family 2 protein [Thioalkalivibrio sp.]|uniref:glycosyltransferase family 2 protein n=1 Tax=Thioalkalivibrio sp. TaxID=2093813 RepID=UPI003566C3CE